MVNHRVHESLEHHGVALIECALDDARRQPTARTVPGHCDALLVDAHLFRMLLHRRAA